MHEKKDKLFERGSLWYELCPAIVGRVNNNSEDIRFLMRELNTQKRIESRTYFSYGKSGEGKSDNNRSTKENATRNCSF